MIDNMQDLAIVCQRAIVGIPCQYSDQIVVNALYGLVDAGQLLSEDDQLFLSTIASVGGGADSALHHIRINGLGWDD